MNTLTWQKVQEIERLALKIGVLPDQLVEALLLCALMKSENEWKEEIEDNEIMIIDSVNECSESRTYDEEII